MHGAATLESPSRSSSVRTGGASPPGETAGLVQRRPLADLVDEPLSFSIEPTLDSRAVLFVASASSDPVGWVRVFDTSASELQPAMQLDGEHVVTAFRASEGAMRLLTSRDDALCFSSLPTTAGEPSPSPRCSSTRTRILTAVGNRLALLDVAPVAATPSTRASAPGPSAKPPSSPPPSRPATKSARAPRTSSKPAASKKPPAPKKPTAKGHGHGPPKPPRLPELDVLLRWASPEGDIDPQPTPTGLRFRPPLDGMALIDAAGRPGAIDVLHYAEAPAKPGDKSPFGRARIQGAILRDGVRHDPTYSATAAEGELEYGFLRGHEEPRLVPGKTGSAYAGIEQRGGRCEAARLTPTFARHTGLPATCLLDPARLTQATPIPADETRALDRLLGLGPRRTPLQPLHDPGLIAWAGDRGFFQIEGELFSALRTDGQPRREPHPFPARRARIAWGAFTPTGEGLAFAAGRLRRVSPTGALTDAGTPLLPERATTLLGAPEHHTERRRVAHIAGSTWLARTDLVRLLPTPAVIDSLRGRAHPDGTALVGGPARGLFLERLGSTLRLTAVAPSGALTPLGAIPSPVRSGFDACERHAGGALLAGVASSPASASTAGATTASATTASATTAGAPTAGAPTAGATTSGTASAGASTAGRVVTQTLDASGRPGPVRTTSLSLAVSGELSVRLTPLPGGGALLTDLHRRHVVWLNDDGEELAARPFPDEPPATTRCLDGRPTPQHVPAPTPGVFVRLPPPAGPASCMIGEPTWTADGALRWFGSAVDGLTAQAELVLIAGLAPRPSPKTSAASPPSGAPLAATAASSATSASSAASALSAVTASSAASTPSATPAASRRSPSCPADMVAVEGGRFCVDRYESSLIDLDTARPLSPDYPPTPNLLEFVIAQWATGRERVGDIHARAMPLPFLPAWQRGRTHKLAARSQRGDRPAGYVTGLVADAACKAAGKRLCAPEEHALACRGEDRTRFPYGDTFEFGACNVYRDGHPAAILHDNASLGHLDPRLNRVRHAGAPLLHETGATPRCVSRWGDDAIHDMVGNLDEWVDDPDGAFAGGFYARSTRSGCDALVTAHPRSYADYSTGIRCCRDGAAGDASPEE
ncbi:SUMF1/EgtB/PvdO family nonheme iron enzyme [Chondromyces crocatus]|uniref:Sulfatase-modifying factor enzyme-like domain-containing protein n=1 Tax=Chondromyces crocatus TaxID=52 RepID=A0A0K1E8N3_CHOCO|nr:SUMF1/EgtB/PvdO family nonheme iron enzyme [Chondromyces crocatus]AKT37236.1 uncharacterized protein CMC5_013670 [Chondromyces crocatus]